MRDNLVKTGRLVLHPFSLNELNIIYKKGTGIEKICGYHMDKKAIERASYMAIGKKIEKMHLADETLHDWMTYWGIIVPELNTCIGMIGFKGCPDKQNGYSEVGYGLSDSFRRRGYMSEALRGMIDWAFNHDDLNGITACEVLLENIGSQKVLENNNFALLSKSSEVLSYVLTRSRYLKK